MNNDWHKASPKANTMPDSHEPISLDPCNDVAQGDLSSPLVMERIHVGIVRQEKTRDMFVSMPGTVDKAYPAILEQSKDNTHTKDSRLSTYRLGPLASRESSVSAAANISFLFSYKEIRPQYTAHGPRHGVGNTWLPPNRKNGLIPKWSDTSPLGTLSRWHNGRVMIVDRNTYPHARDLNTRASNPWTYRVYPSFMDHHAVSPLSTSMLGERTFGMLTLENGRKSDSSKDMSRSQS